MFVLDTNVISELRRPDRADRNVAAWVRRQRQDELFISVITILELQLGVELLARRDALQAGILATWIRQQVLPNFHDRILSVDLETALRCASMHVPDKRGERDAFIAATAVVHGMTVATRNVADFEGTGVSIVNPWTEI